MSTASSISLPSVILLRGSTRAISRARPSSEPGGDAPRVGIGVARRVGDDDRRGHGEVHEHLGSERLREIAGCANAPVRRRIRLERRVLDVLGAHPEQDGAANVVLQARPGADDGVGDGQAMSAEGHGQRAVLPSKLGLDQVDRRRADEARYELVHRALVERLRRRNLLQLAVEHDRDAVAQRHRLDLVVGDVERGHAQAALEVVDLCPHLHTELRVEIGKRLVHEERLRFANDRPPHRDTLPLTAGQRARLLVEVLVDLQQHRCPAHALFDLRLRQLPEPQAEREVLLHRHVRVERVVLEDHRDVALLRRQLVDHLLADADLAVRDLLEPREHAQCRRLAAAGRADDDQELGVLDDEIELLHGQRAVVVDLRHLLERDLRHTRSFRLRPRSCNRYMRRERSVVARGRPLSGLSPFVRRCKR